MIFKQKNLKRIMVRDGMCGVSVDALKNCPSHFKLILCCFWFQPPYQTSSKSDKKLILFCFCPIISRLAIFYPNWTKNTEARNFHFWSILVGRAGRSKNGRRYFKLILCCFWPIISPHTKFHPNRIKNTEVRNFHFWSI